MNRVKQKLHKWKRDRLVAKRQRKSEKREIKLETRAWKRALIMRLARELVEKGNEGVGNVLG